MAAVSERMESYPPCTLAKTPLIERIERGTLWALREVIFVNYNPNYRATSQVECNRFIKVKEGKILEKLVVGKIWDLCSFIKTESCVLSIVQNHNQNQRQIIIMIGEIIREVYGDSDTIISQLIQYPVVAGCLFRSFDELTQHLILRMATSGGSLEKKEVLAAMDRQRARKEGAERFDAAMANLEKLKIVTRSGFENPLYTLNNAFENKLNHYIQQPFTLTGEPIPAVPSHKEFFNLLGLLRDERNEILKECKIGRLGDGGLTRENFDFLRLPLGYKISILIKGFLAYKRRSRNHKILRDVLCLSLALPGRKYPMSEKQEQVIKQLESIRLVMRVGQGFFTVSEYLWNFAFVDRSQEAKLLQCSVIVETNFKVYVQVPRGVQGNQNYQLVHDIMRLLLELEHEEYHFQELIVGAITPNKMTEVFNCRIAVGDYLSFFRSYMSGDLSIEKDLGKWNKIYFLGLQGPAQEKMIPNNVKQELKLWESNHRNRITEQANFLALAEEPSDDEAYYARP